MNSRAVTILCGLVVSACNTPDPAVPGNDWPLACDFTSFESSASNLNHCASRDSRGGLTVRPDLLAAVPAGAGIQTIHTDGSWLFALDGKTVAALAYDNGADYFQDGLARTVQGGKIGYVNESLDLVIPPGWDFAFPFENGHAMVCDGCRQVPDGEHSSIVGGGWGYIDRQGAIVVEPVHRREDLPAPPD